jgi:hypothetical protein
MLKTFRLLAILAFALAIASPAWADDINIIFDPTPATIGSLNLIQQAGTTYSVNWVPCTSPGVPAGLQGDEGCLLFLNQTGAPITDLSITFVVTAALNGQSFVCTNAPGDTHLSTNTCNGTLQTGETVTAEFSGGQSVGDEMAFFIAENSGGTPLDQLPTVDLDIPDFDPSTLTLLATGMALMAAGAIRRMA